LVGSGSARLTTAHPAWLGIGVCSYFFYGRHHSVLTRVPPSAGHIATVGASGKRGAEPVEVER
jgi:hypothetical protein